MEEITVALLSMSYEQLLKSGIDGGTRYFHMLELGAHRFSRGISYIQKNLANHALVIEENIFLYTTIVFRIAHYVW